MSLTPPGSTRSADDEWVAVVRAFVALAQRAAIVPEPTPPRPPDMPQIPPADLPPEIQDPSPVVPPAPVRDPPVAPPTMRPR